MRRFAPLLAKKVVCSANNRYTGAVETLGTDALLKIVPLGGLGHIGGNMMVYETAEDLIVVDCGVLFPNSSQMGVDYVVPDTSYIKERQHKLRAWVITHGHEDHIGALPWILPTLPAPVYATQFTCLLIRNKLREHEIKCDLRLMEDRKAFSLGSFHIDPLAVTHSIPQAVALAIKTPAGVLVHTGDFKIDPEPIDGRRTDIEGLRQYGEAGVTLLLSDSTNAEKSGHTFSERDVEQVLHELVENAPGRVFVTTFASHIERLQAVCDAASLSNRKVIAAGRSMQQNIALSAEHGFLRLRPGLLASVEDFAHLPPERVVVVASGSQGEPQSAMARIAHGKFAGVQVSPGDRVIMSSRRIPGNERVIGDMINALFRAGAEVIGDHTARVHSSGHGFNDEQLEMLALCRPRFFVPLHGEYRHMVRHAALAAESGVAADCAKVTEDGNPLVIRQVDGELLLQRDEPVRAGLVFIDGKGIGDVGEVVLRDRRILSESGIIVCVVAFASDGRLVAGPELATRGLVYIDENLELLQRSAMEVKAALLDLGERADELDRIEAVRLALRRFFRRELDRKPMVVPIVLNIPGNCCG